jgi:hypothetical protein
MRYVTNTMRVTRHATRVPNGWISIKKYRVSSPVSCSLESLIKGESHNVTLYFLMDIHPLGTLHDATPRDVYIGTV